MGACMYYTGRLICLEPDQHVCTIVHLIICSVSVVDVFYIMSNHTLSRYIMHVECRSHIILHLQFTLFVWLSYLPHCLFTMLWI